jgi:translation initiation factor IF-3
MHLLFPPPNDEVAHLELGMPLLNKVREDVAPIAMVEADPKLDGRRMMMALALR